MEKINLMGGLGAIAAFLVGGALYKMGRISPFLFGSLLLLGAISLVLLFMHEPHPSTRLFEREPGEIPGPHEKEQEDTGGFLANLKEVLGASDRSGLLVLLAILCWFMGYNALETWISSFGRFSLGIDVRRMSILTSGLALMFVVFAVPSGILATRFGRKPVILTGIAGLTLLFVYGLFVRNQAMLIALLVSAGLFWALINVNSLPMIYDVGGEARIGAFTGLYYMAIQPGGGGRTAGRGLPHRAQRRQLPPDVRLLRFLYAARRFLDDAGKGKGDIC